MTLPSLFRREDFWMAVATIISLFVVVLVPEAEAHAGSLITVIAVIGGGVVIGDRLEAIAGKIFAVIPDVENTAVNIIRFTFDSIEELLNIDIPNSIEEMTEAQAKALIAELKENQLKAQKSILSIEDSKAAA